MKIVVFILFFIAVNFIIHQLRYPYRYVGYFYPDIENLNEWEESDPLRSLDECREWVGKMVSAHGHNRDYDYECGKDCYKGDPYNQGVTYTCETSTD